ncbi:MAG: hypothetical protein PHY54_10615 [Methylococcales bacterium]|nr:hypothetical protein [Methylococcales bacterium]
MPEIAAELHKGKTGNQSIEAPWPPDENLPASMARKKERESGASSW